MKQYKKIEPDHKDYKQEDKRIGVSWLALLLLPLIIGGFLWGMYSLTEDQNSIIENERQFGVGGSGEITSTPVMSPTNTPTPYDL